MVVFPVTVSPIATAHWIGAAPRYFGSRERMQIDAAQSRQRQHPRRNDAAVRHHDDRIGRDRLKPRSKLCVVA